MEIMAVFSFFKASGILRVVDKLNSVSLANSLISPS